MNETGSIEKKLLQLEKGMIEMVGDLNHKIELSRPPEKVQNKLTGPKVYYGLGKMVGFLLFFSGILGHLLGIYSPVEMVLVGFFGMAIVLMVEIAEAIETKEW